MQARKSDHCVFYVEGSWSEVESCELCVCLGGSGKDLRDQQKSFVRRELFDRGLKACREWCSHVGRVVAVELY